MIRRIASKIRHALQSSSRQQGQSMVELAIITPLLLLLFLGLAEVGAALHSYLIVTEATREGARYGARGIYVTDNTVSHKTRNSAQELDITVELPPGDTFVLDEEQATIIVSRLRKIFSGGIYHYEVLSQYSEGDQPSILTPEWLATKENEVGDSGFADNVLEMNMIAVEMTYDHPQLTGLFAFIPFLSDPIPMRAITIMRLGKSRDIPECCAYPIAIHESTLDGKSPGDSLGDMYNGSGEGNFGWLRWPQETSAANEGYLVDSLEDPCLSRRDFDNATNPSDHQLSVEDHVWGNTGLSTSSDARAALDSLKGQKILVLVWDTAYGTGSNGYYHIVAFAWIRITEYELPGQNRITAIFEGLATECNEVYSGTY